MAFGTTHYVGGQAMNDAQYAAWRQQQAATRSTYQPSGASGLYQKRYGEATSLLDSLSEQQMRDLLSRYGALANQTQQQIVGSGLQATTILPSLMRGIYRAQSGDINSLNDQRTQQRLGIMGQYTQGQAGAMDADAARRQQAALAAQQMGQQQNQFGSQMSYDVARLNSSSGSSRGYVPKTGMTSRFTGQVNSYPGSYLSYQRRYA